MKKTNLVLRKDRASYPSDEEEANSSENEKTNVLYLGGSIIRRLIGKTEKGRKIEEEIENSLEEEIDSTASVKKLGPRLDIRPQSDTEGFLHNVSNHSIIQKKWNGYVESINGEEFTAILTDPLGGTPDIRATFSIDEVSEGDRDLVAENALFDWVISRDRKLHGQIENKDFLIFKRFPIWKRSDLDARSATVDAFDAWLNSSSTI